MKKERKIFELHEAVLDNNISMVKSRIAEGFDVNENDENSFTPLHYAAQDGLDEIANILLEAGADVDAKMPMVTHHYLSQLVITNLR